MKQYIFKTIFLFSIAILSLIGCEKEEIDELKLKDSPTHIEIDGFFLELEVFIWRDFMPVSGDSKMMSKNKLIDRNQNDISNRFELLKQFVIKKSEIWKTDYTSEIFDTDNYVIEKISREGPLWSTGKKVHVISQFRDISTGTEYEIMSEDQTINRTE